MRLTGGAAFGAPPMTLLAALGPAFPALGDGDVAVVVGVEADECGLGPDLGLGDHHRAASGHAFGAVAAAVRTAMRRARAPVGAGFAAGVELGLADDAVVVGVEAVEAEVGAARTARFGGGAALVGGHRAAAWPV